MSNASKRDEHFVGPSTAPTAGLDTGNQPRSRTGANRIDVNGRSLWDRMGGQRALIEGEIARGGEKILQTQESEEGEILTISADAAAEPSEPYNGRAPSLPEEHGWSNSASVRVGEGDVEIRDKVQVPYLVPGKDCGDHIQNQDDQWEKEGGEQWGPYHTQSVRSEPGPASTGW